ncbi:MAG: Mur ligase domain-containing protein [Campylobacterales bacterium]
MRVHFIGIGGIGLSGLARFLKAQGHRVTGSDLKESPLIGELRREGIPVATPHAPEVIDRFKPEKVVYTAVVKPENPELVRARELGIETLSRREFLKYIVSNREVIAVCGAHGKSTTTAILTALLPEANGLIGAISNQFNSNCRYTGSKLLIFEADESDGSFVNSNPHLAIVTNSEPEHMEFYNYDYNLFFDHYRQFLEGAKIRIVNRRDRLAELPLPMERIDLEEATDIRFELREGKPVTLFNYRGYQFQVAGFGEHLVLDGLLAIKGAEKYRPLTELAENIKNYRGIQKRFEIVSDDRELVIIDDYGHHPTEIRETLKGVFKFAELRGLKPVIGVWQPHKFSRTINNLDRFVEAFEGVKQLIILPIWSAGETPRPVDLQTPFRRYNPIFVDRVHRIGSKLRAGEKLIEKGVVIGFGAGDITYQLRGLG